MSDMEAALCTLSDPRWMDALAHLSHDFFHLPSYLELEARRIEGDPIAAVMRVRDHVAILPLILRTHPRYGVRDAVSPYGYPGFLASGSQRFARAALSAAKELLAHQRVACAFVRQHSLLSPEIPPEEDETVVVHGDTVWLDLRRTEEEIFADYGATTRNLVRRLKRDGFRAVFDRWSDFPTFQSIYRQTMGRVSAADEYLFSPEYFDSLRCALGASLHLCTVEFEGRIACAGLFTSCSATGQYFLSGAEPEFARVSPTRLMIDEMWRRLRANGVERLNLGGGVGAAEDSLFKFKTGFSRLRAPFRTLRVVCDVERYQGAVAKWEREAERPAAGASSFFPEYRVPLRKA